LREIGAEIIYRDGDMSFEGFVFDPAEDKACALLASRAGEAEEGSYLYEHIRLYTRDGDPAVLDMVVEKVRHLWEQKELSPRALRYRPCADTKLYERLRTISQYKNARFRMADVRVGDDILVLSRSVKEYKVLQVKEQMNSISKSDFELFDLMEVSLPSGGETIVTPPVLEDVGGKLVVIDGNARFFQCAASGVSSVRAVIVDNVDGMLPAKDPRPLSMLKMVSSTTAMEDMYVGMEKSLIRQIEKVVHPYP
jgi:hypothetical protein